MHSRSFCFYNGRGWKFSKWRSNPPAMLAIPVQGKPPMVVAIWPAPYASAFFCTAMACSRRARPAPSAIGTRQFDWQFPMRCVYRQFEWRFLPCMDISPLAVASPSRKPNSPVAMAVCLHAHAFYVKNCPLPEIIWKQPHLGK